VPEPSGWTIDTAHQHLLDLITANDRRYEQRFIDSKEAVQAALVAADRATSKAEESQEKRNEGMNEFRGQLKDQAGTFITRTELYAALVAMAAVVTAISQYLRGHP
jgi:predicted lysophospholipase L1 biosynthesis ABC-type transport system permease subunit